MLAQMDRRVEPAEAIDPRNAMLDAFEAQARLLIDQGCGPQLEARMRRLVVRPAASTLATPDNHPACPDGLALATVLTVCRRLGVYRLTADEHAAIGALRAWVLAQLQRGSHADHGHRDAAAGRHRQGTDAGAGHGAGPADERAA